jgi:hypothetical protein
VCSIRDRKLDFNCIPGDEHQKQKKKQSPEIKFPRSVSGFTFLDFKRNVEIWNQINIYNLNEETDETKKNLYDHILRMDKNRFPKIPLNYKPEGNRSNLQEDPDRIAKMNSIGDGKVKVRGSYP